MKKSLLVGILALITSNLAMANEASNLINNPELLSDVKAEVKKCVIMTVATKPDQTIIRKFESTCLTIKLLSDMEAQVYLENQWFTASILESVESDGGDIDNMTLKDSTGAVVATRTNVAAFDTIVLAMTGGDQNLRTKVEGQ